MMYRLAWRYGAKFATSNGKLSLFFRAEYWSAIGHGHLLHVGLRCGYVSTRNWGRGGRVFKVAKVSQKIQLRDREGWLWQGILR